MSARTTTLLLIGAAGVALGVHAAGSGPASVHSAGQLEFQAHCAACHGADGKGNGPLSVALLHRAPDLTTYAARNGGAFPRQLAWDTIDGRPYGGDDNPSRQMPLFGLEFRDDAQRGVEALAAPEWQVSERIAGLVDYLASLQTK